jgi:DNA-binding transcriptional regulator YiaG
MQQNPHLPEEIKDIKRKYEIWLSLPQKIDRDDLRFFTEEQIELMKLRTKSEFARKFGITPQRLQYWDTQIKSEQIVKDTVEWAKRKTPNVVKSLIANAEAGDTSAQKVFLDKIAQLEDKTSDLNINIQAIRQRLELEDDNDNGNNNR